MNYKNRSVSQCNFYKSAKGTSTCPNEAGTTLEAQGGLLDYSVSSTYYSGHLTWSSLTSQINSNYPVYVSWGWSSGGGHAVVAYGYYTAQSTNYVRYMDPWDGTKTSMTYSKFVGGSSSDRTWRWGLRNVY